MRLTLIVAMGSNRVIGRDNGLPWRLPADIRRFKTATMGHPIIMGRKTHDSIGRTLRGRINIVVTGDPRFSAEGCIVVPSVAAAIEHARAHDEAFIIGGARVYAQTLSLADRLLVTFIHHEFDGDAFFPEIDPRIWRKIREESFPADEHNPYSYSFLTYARIKGETPFTSGSGSTILLSP